MARRISSALRILESPDEVIAAREEAARSNEDRRRDEEVLSRIVTPRAASQALRSQPRSTALGCEGCTNPGLARHAVWCPAVAPQEKQA